MNSNKSVTQPLWQIDHKRYRKANAIKTDHSIYKAEQKREYYPNV
jgi:hypothetical protein